MYVYLYIHTYTCMHLPSPLNTFGNQRQELPDNIPAPPFSPASPAAAYCPPTARQPARLKPGNRTRSRRETEN